MIYVARTHQNAESRNFGFMHLICINQRIDCNQEQRSTGGDNMPVLSKQHLFDNNCLRNLICGRDVDDGEILR